MTIKEAVEEIIEEAVEEIIEEVEEEELVTLQVSKAPIKIGEDVSSTADIAELSVLLGLTARQMIKLLNKNLIKGVTWNKEANIEINKIRYYMDEFKVCGFTTYTTSC